MRKTFPAAMFVALFMAVSGTASAQVSIGVRIGEPPPPRAYRVPPPPGPNYEWVEGYHYPVKGKYKWHDGYWAHPPYQGAYWVAPYYHDNHYYAGHWEGDRHHGKRDHR
jgi:hypothetical protein